jgi:DNA-binding transcriptional MerR regulator/methylmalonyl-CoA mutase cobalamin-binding subunit
LYKKLNWLDTIMQERVGDNFPIRTVSEITGVNSVTLRAWERRYGLISPSRTPKGHRLYSQQDIQLIQDVLDRLSQGMSISQIARDILDKTALDEIDNTDTWGQYSQRMIEAIVRFDEHALDSVYNDAMSLYPVDIVTTRLIMPLLEQLGNRWEKKSKKSGNIAEEHFFSVYLRNKLGARFHHQNLKNSGPKLIMACLPGEHHEFGILLFALTAHSKGYQVILLGADLPVTELIQVAQRTDSQGVVLAGSASLNCNSAMEDINLLTGTISIPVFIGGDVSSTCRDEITKASGFPLGQDLVGSLYTIANRLNRSNSQA